jgi:hypothetical protein
LSAILYNWAKMEIGQYEEPQALVVFTGRSEERILEQGGSAGWRLDRAHARKCAYAVCTRNAEAGYAQGREPHGSAFLVGKVEDVVPFPTEPNRFLIRFAEFARVAIPDAWRAWGGTRNPVKYAKLKDLGIDPAKLSWEPMPKCSETSGSIDDWAPPGVSTSLSIADAKRGLARTFGVPVEAIEITIRA